MLSAGFLAFAESAGGGGGAEVFPFVCAKISVLALRQIIAKTVFLNI